MSSVIVAQYFPLILNSRVDVVRTWARSVKPVHLCADGHV